MKTEAQYKYDERRKTETKRKLMKTISDLSRLAKHRTKPITKNELSNVSGVTRQTIDRFPEVISKLNEINAKIGENTDYNNPYNVDINKIDDLDYAKIIIKSLLDLYNDAALKLDKAEKSITQRDSMISKLQSEVTELKSYLSLQTTKKDLK